MVWRVVRLERLERQWIEGIESVESVFDRVMKLRRSLKLLDVRSRAPQLGIAPPQNKADYLKDALEVTTLKPM